MGYNGAMTNTSPKVAIVILTWNGKELTLECLRSLDQLTTPNVEFIVADNASNDGTVDAIRSEWGDGVTIIENPSNLGFSKGNNVAIRHALDAGADYVLLLNNDTTVASDFVEHLLTPFADERVGITGPKIYYYSPADQIWFAGGEVHLSRGTAKHTGIRAKDRGQFDQQRQVDYVSGCALMAKRAVFERIGMLDPTYRAYFEDADFCMRARMAGYDIIYAPAARVWHKISASTGGQMSRQKIARKLKSSWKFFTRYARPYHWLTVPFFFAADVIRIVFLVTFGRIRNAASSPDGVRKS